MGHKTAVRPEHLERAAKPLVGIPQRWLAAPQFGGAAVEGVNPTRGINGVDRYGTQVEQGAIAFFARSQFCFRRLALAQIHDGGLIEEGAISRRRGDRRAAEQRRNPLPFSRLQL